MNALVVISPLALGAAASLVLINGALSLWLGLGLGRRLLVASVRTVVQLLVPVLAAFGGAAVLSEPVTVRLLAASVLILGGLALVVLRRRPA